MEKVQDHYSYQLFVKNKAVRNLILWKMLLFLVQFDDFQIDRAMLELISFDYHHNEIFSHCLYRLVHTILIVRCMLMKMEVEMKSNLNEKKFF